MDGPVAGCERDGRAPRRVPLCVGRGLRWRAQQPYLGVHRAVFRPQTQVRARVVGVALAEGREHGCWDANRGVDDELATDGVVLVEQRKKVGRFGLERDRVGRGVLAPAACGVCERGVRGGRLSQARRQSICFGRRG